MPIFEEKKLQYDARCEHNKYKMSFIPNANCRWIALLNDVIKSSLFTQLRRGICNYTKNSPYVYFLRMSGWENTCLI